MFLYILYSAPTDEIVSGYRRRTGGHIKKRLMDMDQQFDAIQTMTENIEHDFRTTKVVSIFDPRLFLDRQTVSLMVFPCEYVDPANIAHFITSLKTLKFLEFGPCIFQLLKSCPKSLRLFG